MPLPSAVVVPTTPSTELVRVTVLFASAVPVNVGVMSLVMLSLSETPLSDAAARSGVEGALGAVLSMVIDRATEAVEVLPDASVAVAVML